MRQSSVLRSPKKEEQQVPVATYQDLEILDDLQGFLGIKGNDNSFNEEQQEDGDGHRIMSYKAQQQMPINSTCDAHYLFHWDLSSSLNMWEHELSFPTPQSTGDEISNAGNSNVKKEAAVGDYWEDAVEETQASLKLNLNYERVLEAWSNRGSLWAQHHHHPSFPLLSDNNYLGEVPSLEEERRRRESSVLRYKEKRQSRLFSKKIRYEVRKLNADKRPRLKGRFVKRTPERESKTFKGE